MKHVYFCSEEIAKQLRAQGTKSSKSHYIYINKNQTTYWPRGVTKENINPGTFFELTKKYKIKELTNSIYEPGEYNLIWDGTNINGEKVSSGVYVYSLLSGDINNSGRMILLK